MAEIVEKPKSQPLIEDSLQLDVEEDNEIRAVSRELFTEKDIDLKTQINYNEIIFISKIRFLEQKFSLTHVKPLLKSFLSLRVSLDRQSRLEFIRAIKGEQEMDDKAGFFKKFFGRKDQ